MSAEQKVQKTKANGITEGSIFGQLLLFFFPILFGTFFQQLYNTVDTWVVGNYVMNFSFADSQSQFCSFCCD